MEAEAYSLPYRISTPRVLGKIALGKIIATQSQQVRVDWNQGIDHRRRTFRGIQLKLLSRNIEHMCLTQVAEQAQRYAVMTLDFVRVLEHILWNRSDKLLILLAECVIGGLHIDVGFQFGILEQIDQVEGCGLLDGGQFAQGHQSVTWYNRRRRQQGELLILVQDDWMVGSNTQRTPHAGVDLHHDAFIWPPGDGFDVGKDGLSCF